MSVQIYKNEIKKKLDSDSTYRDMLFKRGYLLTDVCVTEKDKYPFYNIWSEYIFGDYYLYVQQDQTVYFKSLKELAVIIIGHAYNPFDMKYDEEELCEDLIEAYKKGLGDYFDKVSELTGLHVIIAIDAGKIIACQDACSLTGCYFGKSKGRFYITEHPQLVADICNFAINPKVERLIQSKCYNIGNRHLPGNITPYDEVKRLGANTYLLYDGEFSIKRFYPIKNHPEFITDEEKSQAIYRIGKLIHNGIDCCSKKWKRCAISLSGGTDSKTTLACANGLYDKYSYFSFCSKPQESIDAEGAKRICENLGLKHDLYEIPDENNQIKDFDFTKKVLQHNTSYIKNLADNEIRKYKYFYDLNGFDIELKSWASEVTRVFFERKYGMRFPERLNERYASIFQTRFFGHPFLLKWSDKMYANFLKEVELEKPIYNFEHTDLFYWEIRMGCWGVSVISSQQLYHRVSMPMNNRKILEMFLGFPRDERKRDLVHKRIMLLMNKNIVDSKVEIPNLYFHKYRIVIEKVFLKTKTVFFRSKIN